MTDRTKRYRMLRLIWGVQRHMVDRRAREELASALQAYMDRQITASELDETIGRVSPATADATVKDIGSALWRCYDDLKDHKIIASKAQWDWLSRLLVVLESDAQIAVVRAGRRWHRRQPIAAACLVLFGLLAFATGFGSHLLALAVPFGVVSILLHRWLQVEENASHADEEGVTPWWSLARLVSVHRRVAGFGKRRCSKPAAARRVRRLYELVLWLPWAAAWLMLAPLPLFFQMLPTVVSETEITLPEPATPAAA